MPAGNIGSILIVWVIFFGILWFFLIRPQKKRDQQLKDMRNNLSVGDKVTTIGGIKAKIVKVEDDGVVIEIGPSRTRVPVEKWAIGTVAKDEKKSETKKEEVVAKKDEVVVKEEVVEKVEPKQEIVDPAIEKNYEE
ncbi:MAG: preprotein translocase subunit YajC [Clostridioides sp.]|jgi:preprotein translocase subunit YajC|nr:preprotein translocase subunit YajC [Clostridioides sp.]